MGKYQKIPKDPRGGHVRLYWILIDSMAWRALGWADQGLYVAMRRKLGSTNNGNIEATLGGSGGLRHAGITAPSSLARGLRALMAVGLIVRTREGRLSQGKKICNLFRFTDEPTYDISGVGVKAGPATNEWRNFTNLAHAQSAIAAAHKAAKTGSPARRKNAASVQPLKGVNSTIESTSRFPSSTIEAGGLAPVQPLKLVKRPRIAAKPRQHSVLEAR